MLGVCSEFERIAKVVLDKTEKEMSSRRKRKNVEEQKGTKHPMPPQTPMQSGLPPVFSPPTLQQGHLPAQNVKNGNNGLPHSFSPNLAASSSPQSWAQVQQQHTPDPATYPISQNGSDFMTPGPFSDLSYTSPSSFPPDFQNGEFQNGSPQMMSNVFQQPFVPQDLWQMPMSLEWDWADMTGGAYPSFENGIVADPLLGSMNGAGNGGGDNGHLGQNGMR